MASVAHFVPWYGPESWGGTEQYIHGLALAQHAHGVSARVFVPGPTSDGEFRGVSVHRYEPSDEPALASRLVSLGVDVVHVHGWTPLVGARTLQQARSLGLRRVLTVHVPSLVCPRGTMLRFGVHPCDGHVTPARCGPCWAQRKGVPGFAASTLVSLEHQVKRILPRVWSDRIRPSVLSDMNARVAELQNLSELTNHVVVLCKWMFDAMHRNGLRAPHLSLCRHGLDRETLEALSTMTEHAEPSLIRTGLFVGRWDTIKGLDTLLDAASQLPSSLKLRLRLFLAPASDSESRACRSRQIDRIGADSRFELCEGATRAELLSAYAQSDFVLVPSRWMETGPLVVLEAHAAGKPVLGSDLGGIRELLADDPASRLLPHDQVHAWSEALVDFASRSQPHSSSPRVRSMQQVAHDMNALYGHAGA